MFIFQEMLVAPNPASAGCVWLLLFQDVVSNVTGDPFTNYSIVDTN